jgi:hypothetical protein
MGALPAGYTGGGMRIVANRPEHYLLKRSNSRTDITGRECGFPDATEFK